MPEVHALIPAGTMLVACLVMKKLQSSWPHDVDTDAVAQFLGKVSDSSVTHQ